MLRGNRLLAPVLAHSGWRACFFTLGGLGVLSWTLCCRVIHNSMKDHPRCPPEELAEFEAEQRSEHATAEATLEKASFGALLQTPVVWVLFSIGLVTNIAMNGWLNWLPSYLLKARGLDLKSMAFAASIPFMFGAVGCMTSGYFSDRWFRRRRKILVVLSMAIGLISLYLFTQAADMTTCMILQCLAGLTLFMAAGALWALPMIFLPPALMGSGSGFINMGGQIGGFLSNILIGYSISFNNGNYASGFDVMLGALVLAIIIVILGIREAPSTPSAGRA